MNMIECIKSRRSVRKFKEQAPSDEQIRELVEIARFAPSWKNVQSTRFVAIRDRETISCIAKECTLGFSGNEKIMQAAPVLMVLTTLKSRSGYERDGSFSTSKGTHWESFDAGAAAQTFCLAAHEAGLATVILGVYSEEDVRRVLEIPEEYGISAIIPLGYADEEPVAPKRKEVDDLLTIYGESV